MSSANQVSLIFIVGTAGMLFMAAAIVLFVSFYQKRMLQEQMRRQALEVEYQRKMLQAALESQENERNRVSKDLHDDIGMMLMTMRTQISSLVGKLFSETTADDMRVLVDETHESVRRLSWDLKPSTLERFGLIHTVTEMTQRLNGDNKVHVSLAEEGKPVALEKNQETLLFRIIQESVTNAIRHAQATAVCVRFAWNINRLILTIEDNGTGFDFPKERNKMKVQLGLGLINLENRAAMLGAHLSFRKNNPTGTIVNLVLPLPHG